MTPADIPAGLLLCRASRWNQTARDWEYFLRAAPQGTLVAERNGAVIGTVAMLPYGPFAWISMVLVDPAERGHGIGTLLLHRGLALVPAGAAARLDATPAGEVLYRKLGFVAEYGLGRWFLDGSTTLPTRTPRARPLEPRDWPAIREMDQRAFGASRVGLLERLASDAPEYAWVFDGGGRKLHAYVFGRRGHVRQHIGPLVADSVDGAAALLAACIADKPRRAVCIDVPDDRRAWRDLLSRAGFEVERPFLRMYKGRLTTPGESSLVHAIAGPELG